MAKMRVKAHPVDALRPAEAHQAAEYLRTEYRYGELYRLLFLTGCNTGLRASDLRCLRVNQMDAGDFEIVERKTGKLRRIILNECIRQLYAAYRRYAGVLYWAPDAFVFRFQRGGLVSVKYIHRLISDACGALGFEGNFGSHTMRKSFAREIFLKTGSREIIQNLLHHSKPSVTDVYIRGYEAAALENTSDYALEDFYNLVSFD
jgi:integrase